MLKAKAIQIKHLLGIGRAEVVDDWLKRHKGAETICSPNEVTIFFPMEHERAPEALELLKKTMMDCFWGGTVWFGRGLECQRMENEGTPQQHCADTLEEDTAVIQAFHNCTNDEVRRKFAEALKEAEAMTKQRMVGIKGTNTWYGIETAKMEP